MGINQSLNLEKISKNRDIGFNLKKNEKKNLYINSVQANKPTQGVNASSIAEISGIPRATVLRKLKKLLSEKVIKQNQKKEYFLTNHGKLNEKIRANYYVNQKYIALFVTDIFNLIKKSPLKL